MVAHVAMGAVVVDLAAVAVAALAAVAGMAAAVVARSDADQQDSVSSWPFGDRQWPGHRISFQCFAIGGAWSPCPAFWCATF